MLAVEPDRAGRYDCRVKKAESKQQNVQSPQGDTRRVMSKDGVPLARMRRRPSPLAFLLTGFALGAILGLLAAFFGGQGGNYTQGSSAGYFAALFGSLGALLGGVAFVFADKRAYRDR